MKIIKVIYTTKPEFVAQNISNIKAVMSDLRQLNHSGIFYNTCLSPDGKTFIHMAFFRSEQEHTLLNELPAFVHFQAALKSAGFETPPKQELLTLVDWSINIFN
jgi:hypothetical protein